MATTKKSSSTKSASAKTAESSATKSKIAKTAESSATKSKSAKKSEKDSSSMDRKRLIREAAYYLAEHRGFTGGNDLADWFEAEQQINTRFKS